jgi:glucose-1-phosphate cytidylyltransferase
MLKTVILAGGYGTRLSEETDSRPKPMVEIGGKPIVWHIMKLFSHHGCHDFILLLGYKSFSIKEYFANYFLHHSNVVVDTCAGRFEVLNNSSEPWRVTLLDTGLDTMTGGRLKRAQPVIGEDPFFLTYGDGVSDVDIKELLVFHRAHGKAMTVTAAQPDGRFGALHLTDGARVSSFQEKPQGDGGWINGGFMVCESRVFDYLTAGDATVLEQEPMRKLADDGELFAYKHGGFWRPMDTLRDKQALEALWARGAAPWKVW